MSQNGIEKRRALRIAAVAVFGLAALAGVAPAEDVKVFIAGGYDTSSGIAGGDTLCQNHFNAAGLDCKVWLSDSTVNAKDRIPQPTEGDAYVLLSNGALIATDLADLTDGQISVAIGGGETWTGTKDNGEAGGSHCTNWTGAGAGICGRANKTDFEWTFWQDIGCSGSRGVYCFCVQGSGGGGGGGDGGTSEANYGISAFNDSKTFKAKAAPSLESIARVPAEPGQDRIPMFCSLEVTKGGTGVKNAKGGVKSVKGKYTSKVVIIDNSTGMGEVIETGSGKVKTNKTGLDEFSFDIPAEIFADGFESGDVSAWSYTRAAFSNKKKANNVSMTCGTTKTKSAGGDESDSQVNMGVATFSAAEALAAKEAPALESIAAVPQTFSPAGQDGIEMVCEVGLTKAEKAVKGAKGKSSSGLLVIDNDTGMAQLNDLGSGKIKIGKDGSDGYEFEIPSALFADGFESGDVSAWAFSRAEYTNKKKVDEAVLSCALNASR